MTSIHLNAVVGPDGEITLNVPDLPAGQAVKVTIEVPEAAAVESPQGRPQGRLTAIELLKLPREERDRILAVAAEDAADEYRTNPELTDFEAFGEDDLYDDYPE